MSGNHGGLSATQQGRARRPAVQKVCQFEGTKGDGNKRESEEKTDVGRHADGDCVEETASPECRHGEESPSPHSGLGCDEVVLPDGQFPLCSRPVAVRSGTLGRSPAVVPASARQSPARRRRLRAVAAPCSARRAIAWRCRNSAQGDASA